MSVSRQVLLSGCCLRFGQKRRLYPWATLWLQATNFVNAAFHWICRVATHSYRSSRPHEYLRTWFSCRFSSSIPLAHIVLYSLTPAQAHEESENGEKTVAGFREGLEIYFFVFRFVFSESPTPKHNFLYSWIPVDLLAPGPRPWIWTGVWRTCEDPLICI